MASRHQIWFVCHIFLDKKKLAVKCLGTYKHELKLKLSRERYILVPYQGQNKLHHRYIDILSQILSLSPRLALKFYQEHLWPLRLCHDLQSVLVHKDVGRQFIDKKGRMRPARKNFLNIEANSKSTDLATFEMCDFDLHFTIFLRLLCC